LISATITPTHQPGLSFDAIIQAIGQSSYHIVLAGKSLTGLLRTTSK